MDTGTSEGDTNLSKSIKTNSENKRKTISDELIFYGT